MSCISLDSQANNIYCVLILTPCLVCSEEEVTVRFGKNCLCHDACRSSSAAASYLWGGPCGRLWNSGNEARLCRFLIDPAW